MRLKMRINIGIVLVIIINLFGAINISANSTEIPNYSIWKTDFLMAQLYDTAAADFATRDVYDAVTNESYYYRDIYNQCVDSKLFNFIQVETAQWCVDGVDFVTKPEYFYDVVLIDILQNKAIESTEHRDYQADVSSLAYTIASTAAKDLNESIKFDELMNLHFSSEEMQSEAIAKWKSAINTYNDNDFNLSFIDSICTIGTAYGDALTEVLSILEAAKYGKTQVDVLKKMYALCDNQHIKTSLNKQIEIWENFSDPTYIYNYSDFIYDVGTTTIENLYMFIVQETCTIALESIALFNPIIGPVVATWEIGTSVINLFFNSEDTSTAYLTIKATVEIEDLLQKIMKEFRIQYNNEKTVYNANLCMESYKLTLANAYNGTIVQQEYGYAITKGGIILNLIYGDKNYDDYASIATACREIIKIRYYSYPHLILKCYGLIYYHTDDMSVLASISTEDIEDGSKTIFNGINPWNLSSSYTIESGEMVIVDSLNLSGGTLLLEEDSLLVIRGGVTQTKGTLDVGKGEVSVGGNYNQRRGVLNVSAGKITINGNYNANNNYNDLSGTNCITMQNPIGYMLVNGDFHVAVDGSNEGQLTAGTLELKGDFTQQGGRTGWTYVGDSHSVYGFCATGTHKVIFSGTDQQNISRQTWQTYNGAEQINYPNCSYFNIVESTNPNVVFTTDFFVKNIEKGSVFKTLRLKSANLQETDFQINETFYTTDVNITDSTITTKTLNVSLGSTAVKNSDLRVLENVEQKGGNLKIETGNLIVNGNYHHTGGELIAGKGYTEIKCNYFATGSCNLVMQDEEGYVLIYGDYYVEKNNDSTGYLTAGTLELKGDFSQYGGKRGGGYLVNPASAYGFCSSDKHIVVLSGEKKQTIYTQSTGLFSNMYKYPACSYFNILKIKNTSEEGVEFTSTVYALNNINQPLGTKIKNRENVYINNLPAFVDYNELNHEINTYSKNALNVIPTYIDYENYMATQILSIELENINIVEDKVTGSLHFDNQREDLENIFCIVATYVDNKLINYILIPTSIKNQEKTSIEFSLTADNATEIRAFVCESLKNMRPLSEYAYKEL